MATTNGDSDVLNIFSRRPLLDEAAVGWLFEGFGWALREFDRGVFFDETILVTPSNRHFGGRVDSVEGMANLIFERVKGYAGLAHWPTRLVDQNQCTTDQPQRLLIEGAIRGSRGVIPEGVTEEQRLLITYHPDQINNPEAMIASYAHALAANLGMLAQTPPPGGEEQWPHLTELLAIVMGFGVMFANSAFTVRPGGCGSCKGPQVIRPAYLSPEEASYALAIFCQLKGIGKGEVLPHLKGSLRPFFKRALREVGKRQASLQGLKAVA